MGGVRVLILYSIYFNNNDWEFVFQLSKIPINLHDHNRYSHFHGTLLHSFLVPNLHTQWNLSIDLEP